MTDLDRVLALDAAATPGPWEPGQDGSVQHNQWFVGNAPTYVTGLMAFPDADLIAFVRVAAPEMARTLKELRELAEPVYDYATLPWCRQMQELHDAVLRVAAPSDEGEAT